MSRSIQDGPRDPDSARPRGPAAPAGGLRLLVVDDEPMILDLVRLTLEPRGIAVATCSSAEDALERIEAEAFDAVLSDLSLPGRDGLDLHRELERRGHPAAGRTLILTGDLNHEGLSEVAASGRVAVLGKPFDLADLTRAVETLRDPRPAAPAPRPR